MLSNLAADFCGWCLRYPALFLDNLWYASSLAQVQIYVMMSLNCLQMKEICSSTIVMKRKKV